MPIIEKKVIVLNKAGFSVRLAALFVDRVEKFKSKVAVFKGEEPANGRSIIALLMLDSKDHAPLRLVIDGEDAQEAAEQFEKFFIEESGKTYPPVSYYIFTVVFVLVLFLIFILNRQ